MHIVTNARDQFFLGTVRSVTIHADDDTETTYSCNPVDGWVREVDTWDEENCCRVPHGTTRTHIGAALDAVASDAAAFGFTLNAHVAFVRAIRAAAVVDGSPSLHRRAARQGAALVTALARHGRALVDPDSLDPRLDKREPAVAA